MWESLSRRIKIQELALIRQNLLLFRDLEDRNVHGLFVCLFSEKMSKHRSFKTVENGVGFGLNLDN